MESLTRYPDGFPLFVPEGLRWFFRNSNPVGQVGFTCMLYFRGGHLPEVQARVCECVREYLALIGERARIWHMPASRRMVTTKRCGPPVIDVEQFDVPRKRWSVAAHCLVTSNRQLKEASGMPPDCKLAVMCKLREVGAWYSGERARPDMPSHIPFERQNSSFFAGFPPSVFPGDAPHLAFAALVRTWCDRLAPVNGAAGWGVTQVADPYGFLDNKDAIAPWLLRYPGLGLSENLLGEDLFTERIAAVNWLTMINAELAERVGGPERLKALGEEFPLTAYPGGYMIQAGPTPELGDREAGDIPRHYGRVHELLRPLHLPLDCMDLVRHVLPEDAGPDYVEKCVRSPDPAENQQRVRDFHEQWMRRFEPPAP